MTLAACSALCASWRDAPARAVALAVKKRRARAGRGRLVRGACVGARSAVGARNLFAGAELNLLRDGRPGRAQDG